MGSKRTLDLALSKLCHSQFLRKSGPNQKSYLFDSNGIKLKKKFEHCLTVDRIDLRRVYSDDEAENVLRNGQSAIQIPDNIKNIALKEKEIQQEDNDCKLKLWNLIQVKLLNYNRSTVAISLVPKSDIISRFFCRLAKNRHPFNTKDIFVQEDNSGSSSCSIQEKFQLKKVQKKTQQLSTWIWKNIMKKYHQ